MVSVVRFTERSRIAKLSLNISIFLTSLLLSWIWGIQIIRNTQSELTEVRGIYFITRMREKALYKSINESDPPDERNLDILKDGTFSVNHTGNGE
ncbi:hypothetical protein [Aquiflexum gelatinilyticum]|uniref:Uncharacterized protein n=1 Tax=Aquiflexum gelatinilyticum TaxID=2961943 RepID=A0A9X2SXZ8_9BACT|nr:hypothetical protein [Aquiflexum gelatinilyticum]MCR9014612.1 hypothetical protein [Aquiflexum gelatinilyticum]